MTPAARGRLRAHMDELSAKWRRQADVKINNTSYIRGWDDAKRGCARDLDALTSSLDLNELAALLGVQQEEEQQS